MICGLGSPSSLSSSNISDLGLEGGVGGSSPLTTGVLVGDIGTGALPLLAIGDNGIGETGLGGGCRGDDFGDGGGLGEVGVAFLALVNLGDLAI